VLLVSNGVREQSTRLTLGWLSRHSRVEKLSPDCLETLPDVTLRRLDPTL
jgi:hypothetical protein